MHIEALHLVFSQLHEHGLGIDFQTIFDHPLGWQQDSLGYPPVPGEIASDLPDIGLHGIDLEQKALVLIDRILQLHSIMYLEADTMDMIYQRTIDNVAMRDSDSAADCMRAHDTFVRAYGAYFRAESDVLDLIRDSLKSGNVIDPSEQDEINRALRDMQELGRDARAARDQLYLNITTGLNVQRV